MGRELEEAIEKAHEPFERQVGATMAIIAAVLAFVTVYGHLTTTEELILHQRSADQWAFYQAKAARRYQSEFVHDLLGAVGSPQARQLASKYDANAARYKSEGDEVQKEAHALEHEGEAKGRQARQSHLGEILLEVGIVLSSLAILNRRPLFWYLSVASALGGVLIAATALAIH